MPYKARIRNCDYSLGIKSLALTVFLTGFYRIVSG